MPLKRDNNRKNSQPPLAPATLTALPGSLGLSARLAVVEAPASTSLATYRAYDVTVLSYARRVMLPVGNGFRAAELWAIHEVHHLPARRCSRAGLLGLSARSKLQNSDWLTSCKSEATRVAFDAVPQ